MLHVGLDVIRHNAAADRGGRDPVPNPVAGSRQPSRTATRSWIAPVPSRRSNGVIETWTDESEADPTTRRPTSARSHEPSSVAEATKPRPSGTSRPRPGLGTGTVYRLIGSKEELLASIMRSFGKKVGAGWVAALQSDATPIEKLDALELGRHQCAGAVPGRVQDPARVDATVAAGHAEPGLVVHHAAAAADRRCWPKGLRSGEIRIDEPVDRDAGALRARRPVDPGEHRSRGRWRAPHFMRATRVRASLRGACRAESA